ncbi:MAG TPA: MAE_28990/MAE_18760 family HEPN-like nuclease [Prolixibacteraceae bacterium]|nr:MAE_28990/MAE_18760 family HEPN-like nuclease [Prolixibacteraceae bacterium]
MRLTEIEKVLFTGRYKLSEKHLEIFRIQSVSMMYSIWEGFIQNSFSIYLEMINKANVDCQLIRDEILIYNIEKTFKQFHQYPSRIGQKITFFNQLGNFFKLNKINIPSGIYTNSNVSFSVLNMLLKSFCLRTFPEHWGIYRHPSPNLLQTLQNFLRYRNAISHGGDITTEEIINQAVYVRYKNLVLDLMYEIYEIMLEGLENRSFLK